MENGLTPMMGHLVEVRLDSIRVKPVLRGLVVCVLEPAAFDQTLAVCMSEVCGSAPVVREAVLVVCMLAPEAFVPMPAEMCEVLLTVWSPGGVPIDVNLTDCVLF